MQEEYITDGEGELTLLEKFDDPSYPKYDYRLADIFIEHPDVKRIDKLNLNWQGHDTQTSLHGTTPYAPGMKSIYDLAANQRFSLHEISKIKGISVENVESYLIWTRKYIRTSFEVGYSKMNISS